MQTTRRHLTTSRQMRITVRGRLSSRIVGGLGGVSASHRDGKTVLTGEIADQAQLHGLLTHLRDLGIELEGLTVLPAPSPEGESPCHR